ncbi:MAG: sarcosine oxidase subunit gamma [Steroidobacteraceae bacterium]
MDRVRNLDGMTLAERAGGPKLRVQRMPGAQLSSAATLPVTPNTAQGSSSWALWLGPAEWLIYALEGGIEPLQRTVEHDVRAGSLVVADVSQGLALIELSGAETLAVLATGCGLDLAGGGVPPGGCAQSHFHQVPLILHRPGADAPWRLLVDRAFGRYLVDSLCSQHEIRHFRSR